MKKPQINVPFVTFDLVSQFRLNPATNHELVVQVANGLHPTLAKPDLVDKITRALQLEFKAAYEEQNDHGLAVATQQRHLLNTKILSQYLHELLTGCELVRESADFPETGVALSFTLPFRMFPARLDADDLQQVSQVLKQIDRRDLRSFGFSNSSQIDTQLFAWYYRSFCDFPVFLLEDDSKRVRAVAAIVRDQQFPHVGNISLGLLPAYSELGLREEVLRILVQYATGCFGTIQEEVAGSHYSAISAYETLDFEHTEVPNDVPEAGERVARIRFYRQLRTKEEYIMAGD